MKKGVSVIIIVIFAYYSSAYLYYQYLLPYTVEEGTLSLYDDFQTKTLLEIDYQDPDISYRDMLVTIKLISGDPLEITYIKCSDDFKINLTEGSVRFIHNFAGNIYIRLLFENYSGDQSINSSAVLRYTIIDRTSFLVPKSATKACTSMPGIVFGINITILFISFLSVFIFVYLLIYKRDLLFNKPKQS
ncbi:MAG: hypothetical protein ACW98F_18170 [Candidatus Hodarchaeales archaeon]